MKLARLLRIEVGRTPFTRALAFGALGLATGLGAGFTVFAFVAALSSGSVKPFFVIPIFAGFSGVAAFLWSLVLMEGSQKTIEGIYLGGPSPPLASYSRAETLAIRGRYEEAAAAFEAACLACPSDPEPCLRLARLLRDRMSQPEKALEWLRRARDTDGIDRGRELIASREIIDLHLGALARPRSAMPELARVAERFRGSAAGEWAAAELTRLKKELL